jgi:hypothetical protein
MGTTTMRCQWKRQALIVRVTCFFFVYISGLNHIRGDDENNEGSRKLFHLKASFDPKTIIMKRKDPAIHFVTYGGPAENYHHMAASLAAEADATGWFETVTAYTEKDIPQWAASKYAEILEQPRGGYWIWRYPILQKKASEIKKGDFILFMDSDLHFRTHDNTDLIRWTKMLKDADQGILLFPHPPQYIEDHWTIEHIFMAFDIPANDTAIRKSVQLQGSVQLLRKCSDLDDYFTLIYSVLDKDPWIITDRYNAESQSMGKSGANRHDQSISSVAQKVRGAIIGDGETIWYEPTAPFCWPGPCEKTF